MTKREPSDKIHAFNHEVSEYVFETTELHEFLELMATTAVGRTSFFRYRTSVSRSNTVSSYNYCMGFVQRLDADQKATLMSKLEVNALVLFAEGLHVVVGRRRPDDAYYQERVEQYLLVCIVQTALYDYMYS